METELFLTLRLYYGVREKRPPDRQPAPGSPSSFPANANGEVSLGSAATFWILTPNAQI